ncbi:serine/threonine-protein kinase pim-2-like [Colossoma macropomum]|uniref:serine/threonine-protein kinase pim-2-like n=1 Tax=Colossoma macropomum TaxID=42526 RepID=UPI0018645B30|nr:serine/threonine-protein kinase pim-2-like [Colossoma macropomum]
MACGRKPEYLEETHADTRRTSLSRLKMEEYQKAITFLQDIIHLFSGMEIGPKGDTFASRYVIGEKLGEGGFGAVYKGRRVFDDLQVAIKIVSKQHGQGRYVQSPVEPKAVPVEVGLLQVMSQPPICNNIIQLIEWFNEPYRYILVLERPDPCTDLESFTDYFGGSIDEERACAIMLQVLEAVCQCCKRGVMHRDIKLENIVINTDTSDVKLIDFGGGDWIRKTGYNVFAGTFEYCPPEFLLKGRYHAKPATVWSLGVLLFRVVYGNLPFTEEEDIVDGLLYFKDGLSNECCNLIRWCLQYNPTRRPNLQQIKQHDWFRCNVTAYHNDKIS